MKAMPRSFTSILFILLSFFMLTGGLFAGEHGAPLSLGSHLNKKYTDDLDGLWKRRYVRVLTTFSKTDFFLAGGRPYGFEYSLLKEYEKSLNRNIKRKDLRVVFEFIPVARDAIIPLLVKGYGDIAAAGLTITPQRANKADFTDPYLHGIDEIVVTHRSVAKMAVREDLAGKTVVVQKSSSYYSSLKALNRQLKRKRLPPVKIVQADENLEAEDILELVNSGALTITISDSHIAQLWSGVFKQIRMYHDLRVRRGSRIAWMVRKNNPQLKASLNAFIQKHKKGTLLGNIYFNRYYTKTKGITNPLSPGEQKKYSAYKRLFQKYAARYGFDWKLIMAVAYQESGLNNSKKSRAGAVGIMQVLPSTARDKNIGIRDVGKVENNIHAGVKYLAFLRDRYFNDPGVHKRDRVRFALASYNAGPAKVREARTRALAMGLDKDRWFRNVEMAVLKSVGQETVRYVSNINKYYLLFNLMSEQEQVRDMEKVKIKEKIR